MTRQNPVDPDPHPQRLKDRKEVGIKTFVRGWVKVRGKGRKWVSGLPFCRIEVCLGFLRITPTKAGPPQVKFSVDFGSKP